MLTTKPIDLRPDHAEVIHKILKDNLDEGTYVFAFGSRANWTAKQSSDLDLGIDNFGEKLDRKVKANLEAAFEECDLPYTVDVVDYNSISDSFREAIKDDLVRVLWDWRVVQLGDVASVQNGYAFKSSDLENHGFTPVIKIKNISQGHLTSQELSFFNGALNKMDAYMLGKGDILVSMTGSHITQISSAVGKVSMYDWDKPALLNQRVGKISPDLNLISNLYLYYLVSEPHVQLFWGSKARGSANQANISPSVILSYEFNLPPLPEQKRIAEILSSLDNKIEINKQINQTLEEMAQALFKSWFIDFDPVKAKKAALESAASEKEANYAAMKVISSKTDEELEQFRNKSPKEYQELEETAKLFPSEFQDSELGEIPLGWEVAELQNSIEFINGYAFKSRDLLDSYSETTYKVFKMGNIKKGGGFHSDKTKNYIEKSHCEGISKFILKDGDILMCMTDMKNSISLLGHTALMIYDDQFVVNQRVGACRRIEYLANKANNF